MSKSEALSTPLSKDELRDYLVFHAHKISPHDLRVLVERMSTVREQFAEIKPRGFPHTPQRLEFLADVLEAFLAGRCDTLPYQSACEAATALIYLDQEVDLIPDFIPEIGYSDDAMLVALALERSAPAFRSVAEKLGKDWGALMVEEDRAVGG